jgi:hypothetical protein
MMVSQLQLHLGSVVESVDEPVGFCHPLRLCSPALVDFGLVARKLVYLTVFSSCVQVVPTSGCAHAQLLASIDSFSPSHRTDQGRRPLAPDRFFS